MDNIILREKITLGKNKLLNDGLLNKQRIVETVLFMLDQDGIGADIFLEYDTTADVGRIAYEITCKDDNFKELLASSIGEFATDFYQ